MSVSRRGYCVPADRWDELCTLHIFLMLQHVLVLLVSASRPFDTLTSSHIDAFKVTLSSWASLIHTHWHKKFL